MTKLRALIYLLAVTSLPSTAAMASSPGPQHYYALVFNNPVPGQEAQYNTWYDTQHAPDVVSIPGFVRAQRYVRNDDQLRSDAPASPQYLIVYEIVTKDLKAVYADVNQRAVDGRTRMSSTMAHSGGMNVTYLATQSRNWHLPTGRDQYLHVVMANPKPGESRVLDTWYASHHAPDMSALPGFTGYQLGTATQVQMIPDANAREHLALFAITTKTFPATIARFRATAPHMTPGPEMRDLWGFTYRPIGPVLKGDAIRRKRSAGH